MFSRIKILAKSFVVTFAPIAFFRQNNKKILVTNNTDIVIEGFWRCGNHFAVFAFQNAQKRKMKIAHHFHSSAQIKMAVRKKIPALILIRNPYDCIASSLVFEPKTNPNYFIEYYKIFYSSLLGIRSQCIVSDFKDTTQNFDIVIDNINKKFNANFSIFENSQQNINSVFNEIKTENMKSMKRNVNDEIAIPSIKKNVEKDKFLKLLNSNYKIQMDQLSNLYEEFISKQ